MSNYTLVNALLFASLFGYCIGWKAVRVEEIDENVPAGVSKEFYYKQVVPDLALPRNTLHSVYRFGYCPPEAIQRVYLRSTVNISLHTFDETQSTYLYVISDLKTTQRFKRQCVVTKFYVAHKFHLQKSRIPLYYCQGQLFIMVFNTVHRLALHEFYFQEPVAVPVDIRFEFYHPYGYYIAKK